MFCGDCGKEISREVDVCPNCGWINKEKETQELFCSNCGFVVDNGAIFCGNCGSKIIDNANEEINLGRSKTQASKKEKSLIIVLVMGVLLILIGVERGTPFPIIIGGVQILGFICWTIHRKSSKK